MISIVIAAYNEEQRIGKSLLKIRDYLGGQDFDYEIIVVDDGSTDNTKQVVEDYIPEMVYYIECSREPLRLYRSYRSLA